MNNYIYSLTDPNTNEVRYIGKTSEPKNSLKQHLSDKADNPHKVNWINKLQRQGQKPIMEILEICGEEWQDRERFWIRLLSPLCRLVNATEGGEGGKLPTERGNPF